MHAQASKQASKLLLVPAQIHTVEDAGDAETETTQPLLTASQGRTHAFHATVANSRSSSRRAPRIAMGPVRAGVEADDQGRWAVRGIRAVRRLEGRRGRPLDVLVEWEGEDSDEDLYGRSHGSASRSSRRTYEQRRGNWRGISSVRALDRLRAITPTGVRRRHSGKRRREREGRTALSSGAPV